MPYSIMGFRIYSEELGRFLSPDPLFEKFTEWTPYHFAFNNPIMYSDPSGLEPKKEKSEAKLLISTDASDTEMMKKIIDYTTRMNENRRYAEYMMSVANQTFNRWQIYLDLQFQLSMDNGGGGSSSGSGSGEPFGMLLSDMNGSNEDEQNQTNNDRGNLEEVDGDGENGDKTDEQKSEELRKVQLVMTIPSIIKGSQDIVFELIGANKGALMWGGRAFGVGFVTIDLGLEYAATGEISSDKLFKSTISTALLVPNPIFGVPLIILINAPGYEGPTGLEYQNPNDNTGVRINYNRIWEK